MFDLVLKNCRAVTPDGVREADVCVSGGKIGTNLAVNPETLAAFLPAEFADLTKE